MKRKGFRRIKLTECKFFVNQRRYARITFLLFLALMGLYTMWIATVHRHVTSKAIIYETCALKVTQNTTRTEWNNIRPAIVDNVIDKTSSNTCDVKAKNVAFLKVHKAGSSTVMNIFFRYGILNDLNFVLPNTLSGTFNYLGYGVSLKRERVIPLPANKTFNLLCNHVVYNREAFAQLMPSNTEHIGIIRNPYTRFLSAGNYFGVFDHLKTALGLKTNDENLILTKFFDSDINKNDNLFMHVDNKMAFDFGLSTRNFQNETAVKEFLTKLSSELKLVIVLEFIDESIILMKRYLCWDLKDVLYIELNAHGQRKNASSLSLKTRQKIKDWNKADFMLYKHFVKRFWKQVEADGREFHLEVNHFKDVRRQVLAFCRLFKKDNETLNVPASQWNPPFCINNSDCKIMLTDELNMVTDLIKKAYQKINMRIEKSGLYYAHTNNKVAGPVHA